MILVLFIYYLYNQSYLNKSWMAIKVSYISWLCIITRNIHLKKTLHLISMTISQFEYSLKPFNRSFRNPCQVIFVVYIVKSESNCIAGVPFPVVEQRPNEISSNIAVVFPTYRLNFHVN